MLTVAIREVTAATPTNTNLFADCCRVIQDQDTPAHLAQDTSTKKTRGPSPYDNGIPDHVSRNQNS